MIPRAILVPNINLRRYKEFGIMPINVGLEGWFTMELIHKATGMVTRFLRFRNLITDVGMDAIRNTDFSGTGFQFVGVGTGTTAPDVGQTDLITPSARTNTSGGTPENTGGSTAGYYGTKMYRLFTTAQANGNLTEVGVFSASSAGNMLCRQLILDDLGDPTTLVKTSDFELRVGYEWRQYYHDNVTYELQLNGSPVNAQRRHITSAGWTNLQSSLGRKGNIANFDSLTGVAGLDATTTLPTAGEGVGLSNGNSGLTEASYTNGSFFRDAEVEWNSGVGNVANIRRMLVGSARLSGSTHYSYAHLLDTAFTKTNVEKLVMQVRRSWARHTP